MRPIPGSEAFGGGRGGGGVAYRYKLCDTPNEAKVPFLKNQIEDAHLHNWRTRNMIPLLFQSVLLSNKCKNNV